MNKKYKILIIVVVFLVIWFLPVPAGMESDGMHLSAIFSAVIIGLILKPISMGGVVFIGVVLSVLTNILSIDEALTGFANSTVWLIVSAFLITRGFIKTGLGRRPVFLLNGSSFFFFLWGVWVSRPHS